MTIDDLANAIRKINGFSSMGAGQLAEELHPSIARRIITLEYERNVAESRITTLESALAECRRDADDARRYRWLSKLFRTMSVDMSGNHRGWYPSMEVGKLVGPTLDHAIDAAIARSETNDDA